VPFQAILRKRHHYKRGTERKGAPCLLSEKGLHNLKREKTEPWGGGGGDWTSVERKLDAGLRFILLAEGRGGGASQ